MTNGGEETDLGGLVSQVAAQFGPETASGILRATGPLVAFLKLVLVENLRLNLISAGSARPDVLADRHLRDSLLGLPLLPAPQGRPLDLVDVGSGGGFPAIPLLIVRPDLRGTLVESVAKKSRFLRAACAELALTARVVNARFPAVFPMSGAARFDVLTTRAVADAGGLVRRARRLLAPGARALLWTTEPLFARAVRRAGCRVASFHAAPGAERRGIGVLEQCFT